MVSHGHEPPPPAGAARPSCPPHARAAVASLTPGSRDPWVAQAASRGTRSSPTSAGTTPAPGTWPASPTWSTARPSCRTPRRPCATPAPTAPRAAAHALDRARAARGRHARRGGRVRGGPATGESAEVPAIAVEALDPTGAGDVFVAGFVTGTLADWPLADRLAFAGLTAALSVQEFGGSLSAPGWSEIAAWWRKVQSVRGPGPDGAAPVRVPGATAAHAASGAEDAAPGRCAGPCRRSVSAARHSGRDGRRGMTKPLRRCQCRWRILDRQAALVAGENRNGRMCRPAGRPMTQTPTAQTPAQGKARAQFTVPAQHPMVTVLGSGDSLLRVIETAFPAADIHVRGNEISATGEARGSRPRSSDCSTR